MHGGTKLRIRRSASNRINQSWLVFLVLLRGRRFFTDIATVNCATFPLFNELFSILARSFFLGRNTIRDKSYGRIPRASLYNRENFQSAGIALINSLIWKWKTLGHASHPLQSRAYLSVVLYGGPRENRILVFFSELSGRNCRPFIVLSEDYSRVSSPPPLLYPTRSRRIKHRGKCNLGQRLASSLMRVINQKITSTLSCRKKNVPRKWMLDRFDLMSDSRQLSQN